MSTLIEITSLTIGYNNQPLLTGINLTSSTGQLIAVIGRNGKGKSTLLKTLSGLLSPIAGSFKYEGKNMLNLPEKERARLLSIVITKQVDIGGLKVYDYIAYGRYPYTNWLGINTDTDDDEVKKAIEYCGLEEFSYRNFNELSDGEKQKVNIARAIAQDTPLIILDEPTAHLDLINKVEILKLLKHLVDNYSKTIIISTHQIEYALQICNEIWVVNDAVKTYTPSEMIKQNKLKELFGEDLIRFNEASYSFKLT